MQPSSSAFGGGQTPHYATLCVAPSSTTTVRAFGDADGDHVNQYLSYRIAISLKASSNLAFGGAHIKWQRQKKPAPVTNTFGDVPTDYLFFRAIENLAAAGITGAVLPGTSVPTAISRAARRRRSSPRRSGSTS